MATRATDLEKLIKAAKSRGWQTVETKDGMVLRYPADCWGPGEGTCNLHRSPSASRTAANLRADLARVERLARDRAAARRREAATAAQRRDPAPDAEERAKARQRKAERRAARRLHNRRERQAAELAGSLPPAPVVPATGVFAPRRDDSAAALYPELAEVAESGMGAVVSLLTGVTLDDFPPEELAQMNREIRALDRQERHRRQRETRELAGRWLGWQPWEGARFKRRLDDCARNEGLGAALTAAADLIREPTTPEWARDATRQWLAAARVAPQRTDPTPLISSGRDSSNTERPTPGRPRRQA